ncbi:THUMP domain-containing protein 1 [Nephila pilipes]|uniref:THUMP domain-containing protein 1 n=1 Tax=Nephila pilipes TaxID=299642 RepID=A0A8X6TLB7_NEPPI|nr:THUMP domain-containing protein 1 [Nephila pilipes]
MSSARKNEKRKKKKKYFQASKKQKIGVLEAGLKGFLITCNNEQPCVKESYNLLNEFADELFGNEIKVVETPSGSTETDIEEELRKEIDGIKNNKRRFQQVCTMVKGILFINTTIPDPTCLATSIFDKVLQTGQRMGRFILKMIPIIITCKATQTDIRKQLDDYLQKFTKDDINKKLFYKIESKIRHNNNLSTSHVLWYVRESVEKYVPDWVVSLMEPQIVISVYVLRNICCIGFLKNYVAYKKYNLSETANSISERTKTELELKANNSQDNTAKTEQAVVDIHTQGEISNEYVQ